ncbi:MAG: PIN domain-containing protein [Candidatus Woesearchaeota archaeon]|nr:PIN domain-containing protein [Candidatus Woesearchaeota archaeon]
MNTVIVDSNIFIGLWYKGDQHRQKSIDIMNQLLDKKIGKMIVTNYVIVEVINFLMKKVRFEDLLKAYVSLTDVERIQVMYVDKVMHYEIGRLMAQYKTLTLTDCSLIVAARELNVPIIYSFDGGFDKVSDIERRES